MIDISMLPNTNASITSVHYSLYISDITQSDLLYIIITLTSTYLKL